LRRTKRRRKINVTVRGKTNVAKRGNNAESGAREVKQMRGKRDI